MRIIENMEKSESIRKALKENDWYCPCRIVKNEDTKCMCKEFRTQFANKILGECHCGLYKIIE